MREKFTADLPRHFIFNTINSIIALCRIDSEKASRLTVAFAECLNYTSVTSQTVSLDEELYALEAYLYVQSVRFAPRFKYTIENFNIHGQIRKYDIFNNIESCVREAISRYHDSILMETNFLFKNEKLFVETKINGTNVLNNCVHTFVPDKNS